MGRRFILFYAGPVWYQTTNLINLRKLTDWANFLAYKLTDLIGRPEIFRIER